MPTSSGKRLRHSLKNKRELHDQEKQGKKPSGTLVRLPNNRIVSRAKRDNALKASKKPGSWIAAVKEARKNLKLEGFAAIGGKTKEGQALLAKARSIYKA